MKNNKDLAIYENGDGGDLFFNNLDLQTSAHLYQQVYLARFSGDGNFWGNNLFYSNRPEKKFISTFEDKLNNISLNSRGRSELQRAAENDIKFLQKISETKTVVSIVGIDKVQVNDEIKQLSAIISTTWDAARGEIIEQRILSRNGGGFLVDPSGNYIVDKDGNRVIIF